MVVATEAIFAEPQDITVRAMTPQASDRGYGHLCLRVGRVLLYLEDRVALEAWRAAVTQADVLAEAAFGPELPPPRYEPTSVGPEAGRCRRGRSRHRPACCPIEILGCGWPRRRSRHFGLPRPGANCHPLT